MTLRNALFTLLFLALLPTARAQQFTEIQFINNCPDTSVSALDIYVDSVLVVPGLLYQYSSSFVRVKSAEPVTISFAEVGGTIADTFYSQTVTYPTDPAFKNIIITNGMVQQTGYTAYKKFSLATFQLARDMAGLATNTDIIFFNGSTDSIVCDMRSGEKLLADNLRYPTFSANYVQLPASNYLIRMTNPSGTQLLKSFMTNFSGNFDFEGKSTVLMLCGFLDPAANSNGLPLTLWGSTPTAGPLILIDSTTVTEDIARIQIAHNSADTALDSVDIYINDELRYDNFAFRTATEFVDMFAGVEKKITVAADTSTSSADSIYNFRATLTKNKNYQIILTGVHSSGYTATVTDAALRFSINSDARETSGPNTTDISTLNSSIDAPQGVHIIEGSSVIFTGFDYNFPQQKNVATADVLFTLRKTINGKADTLRKYKANMNSLGFNGYAVTLVGSGFYDTASNAKQSPKFGLYWIKHTGGNFIPLEEDTTTTPGGTAIISTAKNNFSLWPNPATDHLYLAGDIDFAKASGYIYDVSGRMVKALPAIGNKRIDISNLSKGSYFLKLNTGTQTGQQRFIKD